MDYNKIVLEVMKHLEKNTDHILFEKCSYNYYQDFFNALKHLCKSKIIGSRKELNSFLGKMQLNRRFDELKYYKGISEIMFWIYAAKQGYNFNLEKKLQAERNFDIDIQILRNGFTFNIEIKSPDFDRINEKILNINIPFRSRTKEENEDAKNAVTEDIVDPIINRENNGYSDFKFSKINDNKLLDYLKSGQQKFNYCNESSINVLVISVTSEQMEDYWGYLYNGYTGLFTDSSFCKNEDYDKVDVVLLTNLVSGHQAPHDDFNSWDLNVYFNLLCTNPFSYKKKSSPLCPTYKELLSLFPNCTQDFENFYSNLIEKCIKDKIPLDGLLFPMYIAERYPLLR